MNPDHAQPDGEPLPLELEVAAAARLMDETAGAELVVLDVREEDERTFCRLPDHLHLPIGQVPARWQELPGDRHLLVYCHHGMRSMRVAHFLRQMGYSRVQSIRGGIEAWSLVVDPDVPRY